MPPHRQDERQHGPESTGGFVRRLLHRIQRAQPQDPQDAGKDKLSPSGQRSGSGAASAQQYLQAERNSRPTPLE